MAARRSAITAVMVAAVVRRRIKKGYWVFCGFTLGGKVLGRLKYLCFIPDMSSELFRALTGAATLICSVVAAVCDRQVSLTHICGTVLLYPCWEKTDGVRRMLLQRLWYRRAPLWCEVNSALEGDAGSELAAVRGSACTELWTTRKSSLQSNRKRCWSTALQKLLLQYFTAEA